MEGLLTSDRPSAEGKRRGVNRKTLPQGRSRRKTRRKKQGIRDRSQFIEKTRSSVRTVGSAAAPEGENATQKHLRTVSDARASNGERKRKGKKRLVTWQRQELHKKSQISPPICGTALEPTKKKEEERGDVLATGKAERKKLGETHCSPSGSA